MHVRDNWGWCTGVCESAIDAGYDNDSGCFDGSGDALSTPDDGSSECAYQVYPAESTETNDIDPWVYYDGAVYVTP